MAQRQTSFDLGIITVVHYCSCIRATHCVKHFLIDLLHCFLYQFSVSSPSLLDVFVTKMESAALTYLWNEREHPKNSCDVILILDGKKSMAHSFIMKHCGFFNNTTLPLEKVDDKEMAVANIDKLLEVDSLTNFNASVRVDAFETVLKFLYGQEPDVSTSHMAEAVLLNAHFIMCNEAFEWASHSFVESVTDMSDAIRVFSFVFHNCIDVESSAFLRESIKEKVAANIELYLDTKTDAYKEIFSLNSNTLKSLLENVHFSDETILNRLLLVDDSEYSKMLLELDFEVISIWWKTKELKAFRNDRKKFDFAVAWASRRPVRRSLFHVLLDGINIVNFPIFLYNKDLEPLLLNNRASQKMVLMSTLFTARTADSTSSLVKYILHAGWKTCASARLLHAWNPNDASSMVQLVEGDPLTVNFLEDPQQQHKGIRGKIGYTTGCHVFRVRWLEEELGPSPRIGVAEKSAALREGIGGNGQSYGWSLIDRYIRNRDVIMQYMTADYAIPEEFLMVIDSRRGAFGFAEVNGTYLGDAATGLEGKTLYAACSYKAAARVTLTYVGSIDK